MQGKGGACATPALRHCAVQGVAADGMGQKRKAADLLDWLGIRDPPDWLLSRWLGAGIGCILILAALILFPFAILAAVLVVYATASLALSGLGDGPNLGAGALIAAILGAPFLIWATMIKQRALGFQKEGHITDRISKAVEMLGAEKTVKLRGNDEDDNDITIEETRPNIEVRIGGILSLERIAQDSCAYDKGRDHVRVMEILCAYVRENSRANSLASTPTPFVPKKPRLDIQKAVDAIKRRSAAQLQIETVAEYRLDLRETDLDGCDLSKGSFVGAIFWRSRLESTNFTKTDLTAARFQGCLLNFTLFEETLLRGTNLDFAILSETGFGYFARAKLDSLFVEPGIFTEPRFWLRGWAFPLSEPARSAGWGRR